VANGNKKRKISKAMKSRSTNLKLAYRRLKAEEKKLYFMAENDFATNGNDEMSILKKIPVGVSTLNGAWVTVI